MRRVRDFAVGIVVALGAIAVPAAAQGRWVTAKCDLRPGHFRVNAGLLYLKSATETRFEDQRQRDLKDAERTLVEAVTTGEQARNPAAWYYLGRYYLMVNDLRGADSTFTRAAALKPECAQDIDSWRRLAWVPTVNEGIAAWQAGKLDSATAAFRAANAILRDQSVALKYLASVLYQAGQIDSAAHYFRLAADAAAKDTAARQDRRDALFNLARIRHSQQRWADAHDAYREYLTVVPNDPEAMANVASVLIRLGQRDSGFAIYRQLIARPEAAGAKALLVAGVEIYGSVPDQPDTAAAGRRCRGGPRATPARVRQCRDSLVTVVQRHDSTARAVYRLAADAFAAALQVNPYERDGLFNLANSYLALNDSARMLPVAQRLIAVDPMNRNALRILAFAHQRVGRLDSTIHYLRIADSTMLVDVAITEFDPQDSTARVKGLVTGMRPRAAQPLRLIFEFVNDKGELVAAAPVDVPALAAPQTHVIEATVKGRGIVAWRYRREG